MPPGDENYYRRVRYHRLGDDPARDRLVFGEERPKEDIVNVSASADGRWILFGAFKGWTKSDLYLLDTDHRDRGLVTVLEGEDAIATGFVLDGRLWLRTNHDAPNYRLILAMCDPAGSDRGETINPSAQGVLQGCGRTGD